jgi:hypothetical protein
MAQQYRGVMTGLTIYDEDEITKKKNRLKNIADHFLRLKFGSPYFEKDNTKEVKVFSLERLKKLRTLALLKRMKE